MRPERISRLKMPGGSVGPGLAPAATRRCGRTRAPQPAPLRIGLQPIARKRANQGSFGPAVQVFSRESPMTLRATTSNENARRKCRGGARPARDLGSEPGRRKRRPYGLWREGWRGQGRYFGRESPITLRVTTSDENARRKCRGGARPARDVGSEPGRRKRRPYGSWRGGWRGQGRHFRRRSGSRR